MIEEQVTLKLLDVVFRYHTLIISYFGSVYLQEFFLDGELLAGSCLHEFLFWQFSFAGMFFFWGGGGIVTLLPPPLP